VYDLAHEPLARLGADGARVAASVADVVSRTDVVFLCLPSARHVRIAFDGSAGLLQNIRPNQIVIDLGTSSVELTRDFARQFESRGASWIDAPIARTRQAAQD
ncbi:NAD(P)-binding domain-containing protein, partial [Escherichia fergusonii]|uniref:NAD(P)-binding domain-containing protein n=1 Tax=Escherichia fergusonii TaxID=564 RepID=UPI001C5CB41E